MQKIKKNCHLFSGLTDEEFSTIISNSNAKEYLKGDIILNSSDKNKNLYIIKKGIVKINLHFKNKKFTTGFLKANDYFGHIGLFSGGISKIEAICVSPCKIQEIKQECVDRLIIKSSIFVYNLLNGFAENILNIHETIYNLAFRDVKNRIITQLIYLAKIFRERIDNKIIINLPLTQEEISNFIGTGRENVTKALAILKKDGIINIETRKIIILDEKKLKSLAE